MKLSLGVVAVEDDAVKSDGNDLDDYFYDDANHCPVLQGIPLATNVLFDCQWLGFITYLKTAQQRIVDLLIKQISSVVLDT